MKLRLVLVVLLLLPLLVKGQSDVIFYSKGKMYVQYKATGTKGESGSTALYIDGSAKFATGASIKQKGRTEITKDFINAKNPARISEEETPQLFVGKDNVEDDGVIAFVGKPQWSTTLNRDSATLQRIYATNDDATGTTWSRTLQKKTNWINFPTISVEKGKPVKDASDRYLDDWRKTGYLVVDTTVAMSVDYIRADQDNRFAINASYDINATDRMNSAHVRINDVHSATKGDPLALARYSQLNWQYYHYDPAAAGTAAGDHGLFKNENSDRPEPHEDTFGGSLRTEDTHVQGEGWNYLTGFTPPFEQLGADYMFYHTLTKPNGGSITSYEGPIVDPFFRMQGGRGYFMSMEVSHADHKTGPENINYRWDFFENNNLTGISNERRARGGYVFNRSVFQDYLSVPEDELLTGEQRMDNFSRFLYDNTLNIFNATTKEPVSSSYNVYNKTNRPLKGLSNSRWMEKDKNGKDKNRSRYELMDQEKFNTTPVVVKLEAGLNFLGNPFMAPISLNPLLGFEVSPNSSNVYPELAEAANILNGFESTLFTPPGASKNVTISSKAPTADIRAKYWLINHALVKYDKKDNVYRYKTTYDFVSRDAGSSNVEAKIQDSRPGKPVVTTINPLTHVIAPMQMFCLQTSREVEIKIDSALQVFGFPRFTKSASTKASGNNDEIMKDWFIVEAKAANADKADRTTIVFNDNALPGFNKQDVYDTRKGISEDFERYEDVINGKSTKTSFEKSKAIVFTKSIGDQVSLLGNGIPTKTKELALFFVPPATTQEVTLKFYGLENVAAVPGVWLVDRYMDNKTIELTPETEYTFVSEASNDTEKDLNDNRFVLRFYDEGKGIINNEESEIYCYYKNKEFTLYIKGLNENDINSDVIIYDVQGRLMGRTKINELLSTETGTEFRYVKPLNLGTYIAKIVGKRNHAVKFVNLQN